MRRDGQFAGRPLRVLESFEERALLELAPNCKVANKGEQW
jgi:hypothetical protein